MFIKQYEEEIVYNALKTKFYTLTIHRLCSQADRAGIDAALKDVSVLMARFEKEKGFGKCTTTT